MEKTIAAELIKEIILTTIEWNMLSKELVFSVHVFRRYIEVYGKMGSDSVRCGECADIGSPRELGCILKDMHELKNTWRAFSDDPQK